MIVVYTALFGDEDRLWSVPPVAMRGAKYVAFTEKPRRECGLWTKNATIGLMQETGNMPSLYSTWEQRVVNTSLNSVRAARFYKVLAHEVLPEADVSIWIDANVRLLISPREAVLKWLKHDSLAVFKHPDRRCLYREAHSCKILGKDSPRGLEAQAQAYLKAGMPRNWGLAATGCVIRRHTSEIAELNTAWWQEIKMHSARDQISLPYVCWQQGLRWSTIPGFVLGSEHFWYIVHRELP